VSIQTSDVLLFGSKQAYSEVQIYSIHTVYFLKSLYSVKAYWI